MQLSRLKQCTVSSLFKAFTVRLSATRTDAARIESLHSRTLKPLRQTASTQDLARNTSLVDKCNYPFSYNWV